MHSRINNKYKLNKLRCSAEEHGDERRAIWLVHPQHKRWGQEPHVYFHRVDTTGFPIPYAGSVLHSEIDGPIPTEGYWWVDTDGTLIPFDGYGEPDSNYYDFTTMFGFH